MSSARSSSRHTRMKLSPGIWSRPPPWNRNATAADHHSRSASRALEGPLRSDRPAQDQLARVLDHRLRRSLICSALQPSDAAMTWIARGWIRSHRPTRRSDLTSGTHSNLIVRNPLSGLPLLWRIGNRSQALSPRLAERSVEWRLCSAQPDRHYLRRQLATARRRETRSLEHRRRRRLPPRPVS